MFELNEFGEITVNKPAESSAESTTEQAASTEASELDETQSEDTQESNTQETDSTPAPDDKDYQKQYKALQPQFTKVTQENAELRRTKADLERALNEATFLLQSITAAGAAVQDGEPEAEPDWTEMTPAQRKAYIKQVNAESTAEQLQNNQTLKEVAVWMDLEKTRTKYSDFREHVPVIKVVMETNPSLDFEKAYLKAKDLVKTLGIQLPKPNGGKSGQAKPSAQVNAEDVKRRAAKLRTEKNESSGEDFEPQKEFKSNAKSRRKLIEDALDAALAG